jgi:trimeric autotransporter adhesin
MLAVGSHRDSSSATGINGDELDTSTQGAGAVFLFTRSNDSWLQQAYIKAPITFEENGPYCTIQCIHCPEYCSNYYANFGTSIGLTGDGRTLVVGTPFNNEASGEVYIY